MMPPKPKETPYTVHTFWLDPVRPAAAGTTQKRVKNNQKSRSTTTAGKKKRLVPPRTPPPDPPVACPPVSTFDHHHAPQTPTTQEVGFQPGGFRVIVPPSPPTSSAAMVGKEGLGTLPPAVPRAQPLSPAPSSIVPISFTTHTIFLSQPAPPSSRKKERVAMVLPVIPVTLPETVVLASKTTNDVLDAPPIWWPLASFQGYTKLRVLEQEKKDFELALVNPSDLRMQKALRNLLLYAPFDLESPIGTPGMHVWTFVSDDGSSLCGTWYRRRLYEPLLIKPIKVTRVVVKQECTDGFGGGFVDTSTITLPSGQTISLELPVDKRYSSVDAYNRAYNLWNGYYPFSEVQRPPMDWYFTTIEFPNGRSSVRLIALQSSPNLETHDDEDGNDDEAEEVEGNTSDAESVSEEKEPELHLFRLAFEDTHTKHPSMPLRFTIWTDVPVKNGPPPHNIAFGPKLIARGCSHRDGIEITLKLDPDLAVLDEEQVEWEMGLVYYTMLAMKDKKFKMYNTRR